MLELIFSFIGLFFGIALSYLAPEELKPGKKYFHWLKELLFYIILIIAVFILIYRLQFYYLFYPFLFLVLSIIFTKTKHFILEEISNYLLFIIIYLTAYFLHLPQSLLYILASLIFLYGLPAGTLLRYKYHVKRKRS